MSKRGRDDSVGLLPKVKASQQSAAEFFSEHQQIAGFDNPGKSLYTTIREFVENSLDAAESIQILPDITVSVTEYTEEEHNKIHGIDLCSLGASVSRADVAMSQETVDESQPSTVVEPKNKSKDKISEKMYYDVICRDNGCGIAQDQIGNMLGRVLSGSKQGLRQTRGKFGLGAKMVWLTLLKLLVME
jgi:DNA topoisomerase-6 subunit B